MSLKIYINEIGQSILDYFADIPADFKFLGTMNPLPPPNVIKQLRPNDMVLSVIPLPGENSGSNDSTMEQLYKYDIFIFVKLEEGVWLWQNRFAKLNYLTAKMHDWILSIEAKMFNEDGLYITEAEVSTFDSDPVGDFFPKMLDANLTAVMVGVQIKTKLGRY